MKIRMAVLVLGAWSLGFLLRLAGRFSQPLVLLFGFFFGLWQASFAADHGDAARANQLEDAIRPHSLNERFDLALAAGDFDHQFLRADIDDPGAKNFDQLTNLGALGSRRGGDL